MREKRRRSDKRTHSKSPKSRKERVRNDYEDEYLYEEMENEPRRRSSGKKGKKKRRRGRRKYMFSKTLGIIMAIIQFVASVVFTVNIALLDMLTLNYVLILGAILLLLLGITLLSQIAAKKRGVLGKIFCFIVTAVLILGSFYLGQLTGTFNKVTNSSTKTSTIVVAVMDDDPAKSIEDAKDYTFGAQFLTGASQTKSTISKIEEEVGNSLNISEYNNMSAEIQALYDGEVEAIIFNEGYTSVVEEQHPTFNEDVRIIYKNDIVASIENGATDASINEPFAVYLSGIDVWGDITQESRSDVNIVAVVNPKIHQVLLISTPRDYHIPIPGVSGGQRDKLTHAGLYGVDVSMATLSELYDIDIQFFGRVNFSSMVNIVDALGGLDVESDQEFDTGVQAGVVNHINLGMNHFDGKEALAFCRERKSLPGGDADRGRHQQAVITAIIKKMMSPAMLRGAMDIINTVSDGVDTNFSMDQIQALIKMQLRSNTPWNIYSVSAIGYPDSGVCFSSGSGTYSIMTPDETSVANIVELVNKVENGEVIEGSTTTE